MTQMTHMAPSRPAPPPPATSDDRLMRLLQRGDAQAFGAFYERHSGAVVAVARRYVRDPQLAEEVAQETFLSVWRYRARYQRRYGSPRTWLMSIAHNRAIDATRRARARPQATATLDDFPHAPAREDVAREAERRDGARRVRRAVAALPRAQREVIALGFYGELTQEEIAGRTGAPLGTVKGRSRLAMAKLRGQVSA
jgi:RNA polymerase sigma-70 factor (ECF subfamily)